MLNRGRSLAATLVLLSAACGGKAADKAATRPPPLVSVARVEARDVPVEVRAPVDLRPLIQADVGSKTLGYLDAVLVDRGDHVARGQLLAVVRPSDLPDQLAAARGTLAQAQSSTALARTNYERAKQLAPEAVVSQQELQQAQSQFASAEAQQQAAQAQIAAVAVRLGETRITSPLAGVVVQRRLDPGTLVGPPGGGAIVTVARVDTLRVFITVNEHELAGVRVGKDAHVEVDAFPGRMFTGKVVRLAPTLDPATRTLDAEVQLDNRAGELFPGMYGRGAIVVETHPHVPVVPVGAVVLTNRQAFAYTVDPGGDVVHRRALTLGVDGGDWFEVKAGLRAGDEVVVAGSESVSDGMKVRAARGPDPFAAGTIARDGATGAHCGPPSMWLTRLALRNPVLILMMSLMTVVLGFVSLRRLSVDLFPDITVPVIRVATFYTGAGPSDIEKTITEPIERAVGASPGVDRVESQSRQGFSSVSVWFNYGVNLDNAQFEVSQRVAQILNTLPPGIQQPFIIKFDITNIPVVQIAVSGDAMDERQLYDLAYNTIEPQIERINGVASANVGGGLIRELEVKVKRDALRARNLGILDVVDAVRESNLLLPSGHIKAGARDYNVFSNTQVAKARPLGDVIVKGGTAVPGQSAASVRVRDVAEVEDAAQDQSEIVRINGQRGVYLRVLKQPGANTIAVVDTIRAAMPKLRGVPPNVHLAISFDQSHYIRSAVSALEHEAAWGGLLAVLVILIFLVSLRATGIIGVAIPLSIMATFVLLYFTGQTLNVFTLGGLALGVGRLVDDSIVELENIHRHLGLGQSRRDAVLAAAQEVAMPILVSTITTVVVFLPVLFLTGVARNLFMPLALTIAFALMMSFFVSRTVTPLLSLYALKGHLGDAERGIPGAISRMFTRVDHAYARSLGWVLRHRLVTVGGILAVFAVSLFLKRFIGTEFFPDSDESQFAVNFKAPIGTRVERAETVAEKMGAVNQNLVNKSGPIATTMIADVGLPLGRAVFSQNTGPHSGNVLVNLVPRSQRRRSDVQAAESVRAALRDALPGTQVYFFIGGIVKRILNFGAPAPIDVEIVGHDIEAGAAYAKQVMARLRPLDDRDGKPWLTDLQISREENYPELDVVVDRQKAGTLGLSEQQVAQTVLTSLVGNTQFAPIPFTDEKTGNEYFINVRLDDAYRSHVDDMSELFMRTPTGGMVPLDTIARVERGSGPVVINRKYLQRIIDVTANVAPGKDLGGASLAVQHVLDEVPPPEGFTVRLGGQTEAQAQAFGDLMFAAVLAILLVYMVLASQFKSLIDPLVIMFSVPLGVTGVFLALYVTGTTLSVNSFMGIIMMVGIVVSNGVLLVDFANVLRGRGRPLIEATVDAGRTRLRPILMTTVATIVGLIPMAVGIGEGSETNLPLARAVIGGLTVSTVFTLFLVPALYTTFERFSKKSHAPEDDGGPMGAAHA